MYYDLDIIEEHCEELGFPSRRASSDSVNVQIREGVTLEFHNLRDTEDTLVGFSGTPFHFHGKATLNTGDSTYVELDELDVLKGIRSGEILIVEQHINGSLNDRWIAHKHEKIDVKYIEPGEEMRIYRLP